MIAGVEQAHNDAGSAARRLDVKRQHGRIYTIAAGQVEQRTLGCQSRRVHFRFTQMLKQRLRVGGFQTKAVRAGLVEAPGVGQQPIARLHLARLMGAEVGLPVVVRYPPQQHRPLQGKGHLMLGEVKVAELHHGIVRRGNRHAAGAVVEVHPLLHREIVAADAGQLFLAGDQRLSAQVHTRGGVGQVAGEEQIVGLRMGVQPHFPARLALDVVVVRRQEDALGQQAAQTGRLQRLDDVAPSGVA